ncbi:hypothetical protein J3R82DRAFT_7284 [Butyriboletus roseoflavus]|nr:hypothetical protein J3R82DRAFT_7284 [Butyriboletus roseoflavus]
MTPRISLPSRVALALAHASVDSNIQPQLFAFGSTVKDRAVAPHDYVQDLISECQAVWTELINHPFPQALAKGTAALNGFRHYMIQDASYLEYYYRVRMAAVSKTGSFEDIKEFAAKLSTSLQYVVDARSDCTNKLGVPANDVTQEPLSQELENSVNLYESVVKNGDWLDIHIVLLPCILVSSSTIFVNKTTNISRDTTPLLTSWCPIQTPLGCGTEKDFFGLGNSATLPAYNIVSNGAYKIRSYLDGNPYLVADGASVITQTNDPGDDGNWNLTNSADGYTVQNGGNFLGASIVGPIQPVYEVSVSDQTQPWSINTAGVTDKDGRALYQLLVPNRLQWVLDASGISKVRAAGQYTEVIHSLKSSVAAVRGEQFPDV